MPSYAGRERSRSRSPPRRQRDRDENEDGYRRRDGYRSRSSRDVDSDRKGDGRRYGNGDGREGSSYGRRNDGRRRSPSRSRSRSRSRSPPPAKQNAGRSQQPLPSQTAALAEAGVPSGSRDRRGKDRSPSPSAEAIEASKPNFKNSGALAAETNTFKGVVLKYNEPPEARKPNKGWRLYVFKGKEQVDMVQINRQSAYLFGRDRTVVDIHIEHPSSSKQHAVLQFRSIQERSEFGETKNITKPYIIDLESANGTTVNGTAIPPSRYYEIQANDVIQFAFSTREYVVIVD